MKVKEADEFSDDDLEQSRALVKTTSQHYGSFYLRIGAVGKFSKQNSRPS